MEDKDKKYWFVVVFITIVCFLYLGLKGTYSSFESLISGFVSSKTAEIHLSINGESIIDSNDVLDGNLLLENVTWTSTHTRSGKISPGSRGTIQLELDPTGSEVAILYEFQFVDKTVNTNKLLTFENITSDGGIVRTAIDTYSGIISLADIEDGNTVNVSFDFYFDPTVDMEAITEDTGNMADFFEIHFHALQYQGETLVPYVEPVPEPEEPGEP